MRIVIVGSGVGGMAAALGLGRAGHEVTVLERDDISTRDPEVAFARGRAGAPQSRQTHGLLARLTTVLRERFPDVLEDLYARGAIVAGVTDQLPDRREGDDDLAILLVRRTTLEVVLRDAVVRAPGVMLRSGVGVAGLEAEWPVVAAGADVGAVPRVTGVRLDTGEVVPADAVVAACGRRGGVVEWLDAIGVPVVEEEHGTNLVYLTRWYRMEGDATATLEPKMGGDLGFVKFLAVPGDQGSFSATLAVPTADRELRRTLQDGDAFDAAIRMLPGPAAVFERVPMTPISGVEPMAGFVNRLRRFLRPADVGDAADGTPIVLGFHAIGDAHTCTNPLYGRGCSIALLHATLLADAFAATDDPAERSRRYEAAAAAEVTPWFHHSVEMDRAMGVSADVVAGTGTEADDGAGSDGDGAHPLAALGKLMTAGERDPVIARGMLRVLNMLQRPDQLAEDAEFLSHVMQALADPDLTIPPVSGPTRAELLATVAA